MSTFLASNFITKLPFNLQPRLLLISLPRLKRGVVRCLSHKADGSELPVRYIPKKYRGVNKAQTSLAVGKTLKGTSGTRSSSSTGEHGHKTLDKMKRPQRRIIDHEQPNVSFDDTHVHVVPQVNENNDNGKRAVETKSYKTHQEVVEHMNVPQEFVEESQDVKNNNGKKAVETKSYKTRQEVEHMNVPQESVEELQDVKNNNDKKAVETKSSKTCQEVVEHMNVPQEFVEESQDVKNNNGKKAVEIKSYKIHQEVVEHMNVPQEFVGELQDVKNNNGKKGVETKSSKTCQEVVEHMNVHQEFVEELQNLQNSNGKKAIKTKSSKTCQEVVGYMNVPQEVVEELQNVKRGFQGQLNQEDSYDDGILDTEYIEALEEPVDEIELYDGVGDHKERRSDTSRTKQGAEKLAIELLAKRAFTRVELRKKLTAKNFPEEVVDAILSDFQNRGLINDGLYAEMLSQSRWKSSSWGPRRIKQALVKKGVSECDVKKAIKVVFEDDEGSDQRSSTKLSESSIQNLYVQVSKQWQRSQNVPYEKRKARVIRWLQYRGFDWDVIGNMLKRLESKHPP